MVLRIMCRRRCGCGAHRLDCKLHIDRSRFCEHQRRFERFALLDRSLEAHDHQMERTWLKLDRLPRLDFPLALARFLVTFCIGIAVTLAWQSYGDAAREMIVNSYPQLGWLAPQAEPAARSAP
jgi:hypothetical protein